jgi:hypothetical protein
VDDLDLDPVAVGRDGLAVRRPHVQAAVDGARRPRAAEAAAGAAHIIAREDQV